MKLKHTIVTVLMMFVFIEQTIAQCSVCTKTAEQLGEGPANALNNAIVYLMMIPLLIMVFIGYYWWKREKEIIKEEEKTHGKMS
ncbi:MAG: hypothetical protein LC122_09425 [Chitinophagales bacterium]|nr:hypothetical protein [Chitinophagales bacterium]